LKNYEVLLGTQTLCQYLANKVKLSKIICRIFYIFVQLASISKQFLPSAKALSKVNKTADYNNEEINLPSKILNLEANFSSYATLYVVSVAEARLWKDKQPE
jgi:hypothetical protein